MWESNTQPVTLIVARVCPTPRLGPKSLTYMQSFKSASYESVYNKVCVFQVSYIVTKDNYNNMHLCEETNTDN